ncbi:Wzz/FepE/Etk N-terminal domain-containing protein [Thermomonospora amylolytica]|uniref:Wzz/FepE/Etk N-terminal domain-containing protein n=1 Tax=Thermomonospora amylolytica TaxID=1411117 RepID=UPI0018E559C5|nr:Wzz/FepE/Etk N-terminal domain-containing protein [Thermomonospora amylolytica]
MDPSPRPDTTEITDYAAMLRRRWRLIAACTFGTFLAALLVFLLMPKSYTAQASVQVTLTGAEDANSNARTNDGINLDTEAQLVRSAEVAERARALLKSSQSANALSKNVVVTVPPNSTILDIAYTGDSPQAARAGADAFAQAYLDNRRGSAEARLRESMQTINERITRVTAEIQELNARIRTLQRGSAERSTAATRQQLLNDELEKLNGQLSQANVTASNLTPGTVITKANAPRNPSSPKAQLYLPGGLMAGLLIGLLGAVVRDRTDKHVRHPADIERVTGLPVLLATPFGRKAAPVGLYDARSRIGQRVNQLCHLISATLGHGHHIILVTGASDGAGTGIAAANLAAGFARTESRVLLLSANLSSTASCRLLGVRPGPGLAEVLLGRKGPGAVVQESTVVPNLQVIQPGKDVEAAAELLQRSAMEQLLNRLRKTARYIIVETASPVESADAQAVADVADAAVIAVEIPRARYEDITDSVRQLDRMGTAVLGAIALPVQQQVAAPAAPAARPAGQSRAAQPGRAPAARTKPARRALPTSPVADPAEPGDSIVWKGSAAGDPTSTAPDPGAPDIDPARPEPGVADRPADPAPWS